MNQVSITVAFLYFLRYLPALLNPIGLEALGKAVFLGLKVYEKYFYQIKN